MSELFARTLGVIILVGILSQVLKLFGWKGVPVFVSLCILGIVSLYAEAFLGVFSEIQELAAVGGIYEYARAAVKIIAVGFLCGVLADAFSEMGEGGLAKSVTLASRLEIICICLPYFRKIVDTGLGFLEYSA